MVITPKPFITIYINRVGAVNDGTLPPLNPINKISNYKQLLKRKQKKKQTIKRKKEERKNED